MSMGRYLCQLCWSIVLYGERDPCFFNKNDDEVYTVPQPNEPEAMEGKHEETHQTHTGHSKVNDGNVCSSAQQNDIEASNETNSLLLVERISLMPSSRRKRRNFSLLPLKCLRGMNRHSDSKTASPTNTERDGNKGVPKSKSPRKIESAPAVVPAIGVYSGSEMATNSAALGSVSGAGPSGIQTQPRKTEREKRFVCDVCGKAFYRTHLEVHGITHTGDRPFVCSTCGKRFSQKGNLTYHLRTHTAEKPFECGKKFAQKIYVVPHMVTHSGGKAFKCKFCDECFPHQSSCIRHQKRKHGGM